MSAVRPARTRPADLPGLGRKLFEGARGLLPGVGALEAEIRERLHETPLRLNEYGYDPYGFHPEAARPWLLLAGLAYRYWFRVETHGIEQVPPGGVLLVANHAGQVGYDGIMLALALVLDAEPPRICRGMSEYALWHVPGVGTTLSRTGTVVGTPENCVEMLEAGECVMVFPEGADGANKPFRQRYRLQPFGMGFLRIALETRAPVVPVGIVGSEEQQPGLANLKGVARSLGLPSLPITVTFPWLGPLGIALALPVKYHIHFGAPLHFEGEPNEEDAVVEAKVRAVKRAVADLLDRGRRARRSLFF